MEPDDETAIGEAEQRELRAWRRDQAPPPELEQRVVDGLRQRGLLGRPLPPSAARRSLLTGIAIAAIFILGVWLGRALPDRPAPAAGARFILLLYEDEGFARGGARESAERVREYGAWARRLARSGQLVAGDELGEGGQQLLASTRAEPVGAAQARVLPGGYFVIVAPDEAAALRVAETCPHLRHGGRIVVRRIVT
jgi:hypothetical protein